MDTALIKDYQQTRAANNGLLDQLRAHTAVLSGRLQDMGGETGFVPDAGRGRQIIENQLAIKDMQQREQMRQALNNDVGSRLQAEYLPHRVLENEVTAASKVQAAQNLTGNLIAGTHPAMQGNLGSQLATVSGLQAGGMNLGQALAHVAGDTLAAYQAPTHEEIQAKMLRQYGTGAHIPMNGVWNPR